ncbi:MAG: VCBS repeat-containing protein [bacterium]|nr:VCBS repeat-containing protein [bacterium]
MIARQLARAVLIGLLVGVCWSLEFERTEYIIDIGAVCDIFVEDFDSDGDDDLLLGTYWPGRVHYLQRQDDGSFISDLEWSTHGNGRQLVIGDFDNDGDIDAAYASYDDNSYVILRNQWTGEVQSQFEPEVLLTHARGPVALIATDVNGDSLTDLVGAELRYEGRTVRVFEQRNHVLVQASVDSLTLGAPTSFASADIDRDGLVEVYITSSTGGILRMRYVGGDYEFNRVIPSSVINSIKIFDVGHDGTLKSTVVNQRSTLCDVGSGAAIAGATW